MKRHVVHVDPAVDDREAMERWVEGMLPLAGGADEQWSIEVSEAWPSLVDAADSDLLRLGCTSLAARLLGRGVDRTSALRRIHAAFDDAHSDSSPAEDLGRVAASLVLFIYATAVVAALRVRGIDSLVLSRVQRNDRREPSFVAAKRIHVLPLGSGRLTATAAEV